MAHKNPGAPKPPYRLLICDDLALVRQAIQHAFENHSEFEVLTEATGGQEAIAKTIQLSPDLVLMDINLPDLDGIEATRQIRLLVPGTKVLAYSSDSAWETVDRMFTAGADGYVLKGSDMSELIHAARTVLAGGHYLSHVLLQSGSRSTDL